MKISVLSAVLAACAVSVSVLGTAVAFDSSISPEPAVCCPCSSSNYCLDGTPCTPYCGYGPCNIFGCNCDGGCRRRRSPKDEQSVNSKRTSVNDNESSNLFDITDTNKDGKITLDEWRNSPVRSTSSGETDALLAKQWAKFDTLNVGYLTKDEALNLKA
ncbi:hypothetical protein L208DRAFT_614043 [Tricholoma matsutake]|nr:hypothetical protein L208DRAFT_614043 [Tricholoma matsutake 945]